ncbi:MAG TPA: MarR family transcriptional regulator [Vitreimonas sp.]|nr:MarR family transcriptional regulator [Vitreimonas sp.]
MNEDEAAFVESVAGLFYAGGVPRAAGRMWGWLLIADPAEQTAAALAEVLDASRGSISGSARLLESAGLVRRTTRRGDRREYFSIPPGAVLSVLQSRLPATIAWRRLTEDGLALLADAPAERRARLKELHALHVFMERELPALLDRFMADRAGNDATEGES